MNWNPLARLSTPKSPTQNRDTGQDEQPVVRRSSTSFASSDPSPSERAGKNKNLVEREWWWLGWGQEVPVRTEQWVRYSQAIEYHLSASYDAMRLEGRRQGLVLDLGPFTEGEQPYQVWMAKAVTVENTNEPALVGKLAIAGYTRDLWQLPKEQLPAAVQRGGKVRTGFYQIFKEHVEQLQVLNDYLTDARSPPCPITSPVRRRVVILIETERPAFIFQDVNRFRKKKSPSNFVSTVTIKRTNSARSYSPFGGSLPVVVG